MMGRLRSLLERAPADHPGRRQREQGQILVLFTLVLVVILAFTALVIDVGVLRNANQNLWNAFDAGALAGASKLPDDPAGASALARQFANLNYPGGLPGGPPSVSYRCLIGSVGGSPRLSDVPSVCDPGPGVTWSCNSTVCVAPCDPSAGDTCNTVVLDGTTSISYRFGPAAGVLSGSTQQVTSAACKGPCGAKPTVPVDLMVVVDRTGSMSGVDTTNARAASDAVRKAYNPVEQWMGYGMLGPSQSGGGCITQPAGSIGTANLPTDLRRWVPVALSGIGAPLNQDYTKSSSTMAGAISCYTNSGTGTDLSDPVTTAAYELVHSGRSGVTKGIILMTDGQPNNSTTSGPNYCAQAYAAAVAAKNAGIEVFTIGFGLDGSNNATCPDTSGAFHGLKATQLLARMATNSVDGGCPGTSNDDGDHFFCIPKTNGASTNLASLFTQAAGALAGGTKLVPLP
jgi:Flp pilus assembly protein TadG